MSPAEQFKREILEWASKIGVAPREIHIRKMKNKWASCSTRGRLTFDPSLIDESPRKRREVVVHELLHLRYPNHGKMFKQMLRAYTSAGRTPQAN